MIAERQGRLGSSAAALVAAVLFGASFPLSKVLLRDVSPQVLAGIFYLASGLGTGALWWFMTATMGRAQREAPLQRRDWGWLAAATVSGGVIGPVLLLLGVARTPAHVSALLANSETVFTALFAVLFFGDFLLRREVFGIGLIVLGAVSVAFVGTEHDGSFRWQGPLLVLGAAAAWGVDNNCTQRVSARDPLQLVAIKGTVAGAVNLLIAAAAGITVPWQPRLLGSAALVGFFCYGLSIALFVLGLRGLGAARTGALFATAPVFGVLLSWVLLGELPATLAWVGGSVMIAGALLLIRTKHGHQHVHEPIEHEHRHIHDEHHQHEHTGDRGPEPHSHPHRHERLEHTHAHVADLHHRHPHH